MTHQRFSIPAGGVRRHLGRDVEADLNDACVDIEATVTVDYVKRVQVRGDLRLDELILAADEDAFRQEWDVENRLLRVTDVISGAVTAFTYDGDGNRVLTLYPDDTWSATPARTSR